MPALCLAAVIGRCANLEEVELERFFAIGFACSVFHILQLNFYIFGIVGLLLYWVPLLALLVCRQVKPQATRFPSARAILKALVAERGDFG